MVSLLLYSLYIYRCTFTRDTDEGTTYSKARLQGIRLYNKRVMYICLILLICEISILINYIYDTLCVYKLCYNTLLCYYVIIVSIRKYE